MTRVLIVDDEPSYRQYLSRYLAREGYEVVAAASGREAIELGARFRPDVLVVDWMLKNHVHGLHVSEALRAVEPALATLLITGFPSRDLKAAAERARIFRFVEKPFELEEIRLGVEQAAAAPDPKCDRPGAAVVEVDADGAIAHASPAARALFSADVAGTPGPAFRDLFEPGGAPDPGRAAEGWVPAVPAGDGEAWCARTHPPQPGRTRLWVLRRERERADVALTEMLLGVEEPREQRWPLPGRVLVLDDDELFRHVAVAILESAGVASYAVETDAEALRLLGHDPGIAVLVVDYEIPGADVAAFVARARAYRPDLRIVGNSAFERSQEFAALGVPAFARKPWRPRDLIDALA